MIRSTLKNLSLAAAATAFVVAVIAPFASAVQRNVVEPSQMLSDAMQQCNSLEYTAAQRQCISVTLSHAKGQLNVAGH